MKICFKLFLLAISYSFLSCNKMIDYGEGAYVQFVNESSHIVSAKMENTPDTWCKIYDFTLKPGEICEFSYEGLGVLLEKAVVTFDNDVTIVHDHRQSKVEGFRNMCFSYESWWEKQYEGPRENIGYYTYRFLDSDYEYASNRQ